MTELERPQIYLVTPSEFDLETFIPTLKTILDSHEIACVRVQMATTDESTLGRAADAIRETCHARDIAVVMTDHIMLAQRHGLDGVHLAADPRGLRDLRKELGADAIIGAHCGTSKHDGMSAGEAGADYVVFGPVGTSNLGDGTQAGPDLFRWWIEMIEVPVVAEGALDDDTVKSIAPVTDFFAIGDEIWTAEDPNARLGALIALMG
ncbi:MAG: thiamine phosphate synthase [Halocynthiibacter sp.]